MTGANACGHDIVIETGKRMVGHGFSSNSQVSTLCMATRQSIGCAPILPVPMGSSNDASTVIHKLRTGREGCRYDLILTGVDIHCTEHDHCRR